MFISKTSDVPNCHQIILMKYRTWNLVKNSPTDGTTIKKIHSKSYCNYYLKLFLREETSWKFEHKVVLLQFNSPICFASFNLRKMFLVKLDYSNKKI